MTTLLGTGGGGDDGGDDDDDYSFDEGDDGDDKNGGFFRMLLQENYSMQAIEVVLAEWGQTIATLPLILQTAVQMGLLSSAQLVRFCAMDNRPTVTRWVARRLPAGVRRCSIAPASAIACCLRALVDVPACSSLHGARPGFGKVIEFEL